MSHKLRVTAGYAFMMIWPFVVGYAYADLLATEWVAVSFRQFVGFMAVAAAPVIVMSLWSIWVNTPEEKR